jgi:phosphoribosylformylglycinamidine synthase
MTKSSKLKEYNLIAVVTLKIGVLDPQGKAIEGALKSIGFPGIIGVRQGKLFETIVMATNKKEAESILLQSCEKLLANTIVENFRIIKG